jgi:hypothetical protein
VGSKSAELIALEKRLLDAVKKMVHERSWTPKIIYLSPHDHEILIKTNRERRTRHQRNYIGELEVRITHNARGLSWVMSNYSIKVQI